MDRPRRIAARVRHGEAILSVAFAIARSSATDGTAGGTSQSEFLHQRKFFEGTYAARVKFADVPVSGNLIEIIERTG